MRGMHVRPACLPCLMTQAFNTARMATNDEALQQTVLREVAAYLEQADTAVCPAHFSQPIYAIVSRLTGVADPYAELRRRTNALALELLPDVRDWVSQSRDPLAKALHAAAAGNVIDAGINSEFDVREDMQSLLRRPFAVNDLPLFQSRLKRGSRLLYLADNAGEIVFDALAIDRIQRFAVQVTVVVKSGPIINDAMMEDARAAHLPELCTVIESGSADIGINWQHAAPGLRDAYTGADLVLAKGHGHFETLRESKHAGLFFLLKAKCPVVAADIGCRMGDLVFAHAALLRTAGADSKPRAATA